MASKSVWNAEPKSLGIKAALSPLKDPSISGVVVLSLHEVGIRICNIRFPDSLASMLGKHMPYGVGPAHPCYLKVVQEGDAYVVRCGYIRESVEIVLWEQDTLPAWCKNIKEASQ
jgi:hypothetical protein